MTTKGVPKPPTPIPKAAVKEEFQLGPWTCTSIKSHILKSEGLEREEFEAQLNLPHLPEMVFDKNCLRLQHQAGFGLQFNALDALKLVDYENDSVKVAEAEEWLAARAESEHIKRVVRPFDWTFTTDYMGTLLGKEGEQLEVSSTDERIDIERLKKRDKIHFSAELLLFEDELHDSGASILDVKIRIMPDYLFLLQRLFIRVDQVIIRINDTRVFHQAGTDYIIREYTSRESRVKDLKVPPHYMNDPILICDHLRKTVEKVEKLKFPQKYCNLSSSDVTRTHGKIPATAITQGLSGT